ncbi:MAG TPA: aminoglycoside phosphotransferase family protein [Nitrospirota bacterium]|nr:aminoglycoside phosphotransferase family protein [Nitrospirota bacterium]
MLTTNDPLLPSLITQFAIPGILQKVERFGRGLINDTYLCECNDGGTGRRYILQRVNASVFAHPDQVMENVDIVTAHIAKKLRAEGIAAPSLVTPSLVHAKNSKSYICDDTGAYWRVFNFIESGTVFDTVVDVKHAFEVGCGLGRFQALVADLSSHMLYDTLPGFHFTPRYLKEFDDVLKTGMKNRIVRTVAEQAFVELRRPLAPALTDLIASNKIPLRVVHNDPKVNNIMIHLGTREAMCMIDLDTVKPGIVHFDFGDCVRSAANPKGEDATDLDTVRIDLTLFEAVASGYLREAAAFLTKMEIAALPLSVQVITFELGVRFLADYLKGDTYFRINYPDHNLHRARVQFKLLESIEAAQDRLASIVAKYAYPP